jgi:hypothetical protein
MGQIIFVTSSYQKLKATKLNFRDFFAWENVKKKK